MELTLLGLRIVERVAALGSFTAAADALGYTQSAVSRQVGAMEQAAGSTLFERRARGVVPTAAGEVLVRHAGTVLGGADAAGRELAALRDRLAGRLSVGSYPTGLAQLVPRALARLRAAHPGITVTLHEGGTPTHLRRLRARQLELAVVATGPDLPYDLDDLRHDTVLRARLFVAMSTGHRLADRDVVPLDELRDEPWIVGVGLPGEPQFGAWPGLADPTVAFTLRDWPARLGLVDAGLGVTVVPGSAVAALPVGVRALPVDDPDQPVRTALAVTRPDRSPQATAMIDALRAEGQGA